MRGAPLALALLACGSLLALPPAAADAGPCAVELAGDALHGALDAKHGAEAAAAAGADAQVDLLANTVPQVTLGEPSPLVDHGAAQAHGHVAALDAFGAASVGLADDARQRAAGAAVHAVRCATM